MGRAQLLLQAIQDFRKREEGQGSSSIPVLRGRVGITPRNLSGRFPGGPGMCVPPNSPTHPGGRGRGRALPPTSPTSRVGRFQNMPTGVLRHPTTMPHCLQPSGQFPSPPDIPPDPNAPPHYEDLFPLVIVLLCVSCFTTIPQYLHMNPLIPNTCPYPSLFLFGSLHLLKSLLTLTGSDPIPLGLAMKPTQSSPSSSLCPYKTKKNLKKKNECWKDAAI